MPCPVFLVTRGTAGMDGNSSLEPGWDEPIGNQLFSVYVEDWGEEGA